MTELVETTRIEQTRDLVFHISQDYGLRLDWDPFLQDIRFVGEQKELVRGLKVWVRAHNGMEMTVKYLNYKKPDLVSMKMIQGPWVFNQFSGLWKFDVVSENETRLLLSTNSTQNG